ncbi:SusC/RagA family TonB-linked outer membrane protein [Autumnicola psychrophila]|uniref:TonB-dependent receptor n=1 Tax=Autumnicola psychrophila TaxID=3075592 RepID=A0ABU3DVT5_9FLAO|nr:TonB-dependent receptor [Zunongwangia sp. F225]MDT0687846.1 TonB-dependent receptor [Zunongwangia sp. F225]
MNKKLQIIDNHLWKKLLFFLFLIIGFGAHAQNITVSGTVTDDAGPLPGVTVVIKGSTDGTTTNFNGEYTLNNVPANSVLEFSFIGFITQGVPVNNRDNIDVVMREDTEALDEIVVIGYGAQRKESVTGSVASIQGDELKEVPSSNVTQALQGRLAGVELSPSSSKPGAPLQIRIRGTRSLNASNDPLIVLDGIPFAGSIADISPSDIKSLDILKDASATAIYGSRGANGVVLITTNKGKKGEAEFRYNGFVGLKSVFGKYPMMNGPDFVELREEAGIYDNTLDESNDINTDWQDLLYESALTTNHDVSVVGGTENGSYSAGMDYNKDEAVLPLQYYERISLRASVDQSIGEFLRVGLTTNNNYSVSNGNSIGMYGALNSSPIASPYNEDGSLKRVISMPLDEQWVYTSQSLNDLGDSYVDKTRGFGSYNSIFAEVKIPGIEGLSYRLNLGLNYRQSNGGYYQGEGVFSTNESTISNASITNSHTFDWTAENLLTYDKTFAEKHDLNLLALYSSSENLYYRSQVNANDIPADAFQYFNLGRANEQPIVDPNQQAYLKSGLQSVMGRVMYSYDSRYMLSASYRYDGSSRLSEGNKWVSYPAISAGWNIHNESFMQDVDYLNLLKIRAGYGTASNQSIDPYSTLGLLSTRPYNFGDTYTTGLFVSELPNDNLGWEYSTSYNLGLEFGLFTNRLTGTLEYYDTRTKDLLFRVGLPTTSGVNSYIANIGESTNKGFEASLNGIILDNPDGFSWDVGVNFYRNRNELTKLASGQERDESNWWFVGNPINVIYDYEAIGLWNEGDEGYEFLQTYEPGGNEGMVRVKYTGDFNADGSPTRAIGPDDRQIMDMQPDFQGGFNTRLSYKNLDLSMVGVFQSGGLLIATPYGANGYLNILSGRRGNIDVDYWTPENTDAMFPKPGGIGGDQPKYLNSLSYFDASYLKLRTITLGYNFDNEQWLEANGLNRLRLYLTAQNPFVLFSPYNDFSGMDPETNSYGNENAAVPLSNNLRRLLTIGTNTPTTRNFIVGLNVSF